MNLFFSLESVGTGGSDREIESTADFLLGVCCYQLKLDASLLCKHKKQSSPSSEHWIAFGNISNVWNSAALKLIAYLIALLIWPSLPRRRHPLF